MVLLLTLLPGAALAVQVCELDGRHVNPANGSTTAGKTGLMRCRDGEAGPVVREQELRNGVFMGLVRYYKDGVLQREYSVNERGNRDGLAREFAATPGAANPLLREETLRNGTTVGLVRRWHADGTLRRAGFHADDGREQAVAEFNAQGQLAELRCGPLPRLAPAADDAAWCGHAAGAATVPLFGADGRLRGRVAHERGELRRSESFWGNGQPREQVEIGPEGGTERRFAEDGTRQRELQWVGVATGGRTGRVTVLDREFHERGGTLVRERRWQPPADADGRAPILLLSDKRWYLNGQLREASEATAPVDGRPARRETSFHDNGQPSATGLWLSGGRNERQASGVHQRFDATGRLRLERHHDAQGRVAREREFDAGGQLQRDDELFEDGSRKASGR